MEIPGQKGTRPGQFQRVHKNVSFCEQTEAHVCSTCGNTCMTTTIAQGLHKICTRVSGDECLNQDDISDAIRQVARKCTTFSQPRRNGIMVVLQSVLNAATDTCAKGVKIATRCHDLAFCWNYRKVAVTGICKANGQVANPTPIEIHAHQCDGIGPFELSCTCLDRYRVITTIAVKTVLFLDQTKYSRYNGIIGNASRLSAVVYFGCR